MPEEEVELIDYLRVIGKRRRLIVLGSVGLITLLMLAFFLEYLDQVKRREQTK